MTDQLPEHLANSGPAPTSSDKAFGRVMAGVAIVVAWWTWHQPGPVVWVLLGSGVALALIAQWRASWLGPLNRLWDRFGLLLHRLVSPLALALVYAVAFVPLGILLRLSSKDPLKRRFDADAASYWIKRTPPGRADAQMRKQF